MNWHAGFNLCQFGRWQFCTPLQAVTAIETKQLVTGLHHGAEGAQAAGDGAVIRSRNTGLIQSQTGILYGRLQTGYPRLGGPLRHQIGGGLLFA